MEEYMIFNEVVKAITVDDAFVKWWDILASQSDSIESRDGKVVGECINAITVIEDPTKCIMRNKIRKMPLRYAIGEMLWYMSGKNELKPIQLYTDNWNRMSDDGIHVNSNYGYCIKYKYGFNQWDYVVNLLREHRETRQALIHIKAPDNIPSKDVNCTVALQFIIRDDKLYLTVYMRSNDLWLGFPFDVFQFANMQVLMAMELGCGLGTYTHIAGSLHLYERDFKIGYANANECKTKSTTDISKAKQEAGNEWMSEKDKLMMEALRKADTQFSISEKLKKCLEKEREEAKAFAEQYDDIQQEFERLKKQLGENVHNTAGTGKCPKGV